jgi:hypothetical protein
MQSRQADSAHRALAISVNNALQTFWKHSTIVPPRSTIQSRLEMANSVSECRVFGARTGAIMLQADVLKVVMGASSFLGVVGLLSYLYFALQLRQAEQSVQSVLGGDSLFNASQVLSIMAQFKDDASRLEALK